MEMEFRNLSCGYGQRRVVDGISLKLKVGEVVGLLGANGCGKTTLIKTILGLLPVQGGEVLLDGKNIRNWTSAQIARVIGYIPQMHTPPFPFEVLDVVLMGRTAHIKPFSSPSPQDVKIAEQALDMLNISYLRDRVYTEISGGERQLVLIARALAQEPRILIMDEPTASLDFGNQIKVLSHVKQLAGMNIAVLMSCHFPEHAFIYSNRAVLLNEGKILHSGTPGETITAERLKTLYGVDVDIVSVKNRMNQELRVCIPSRNFALQPMQSMDRRKEYAFA
ncbi:MAG: ABC transporter ATP-binding protein [Syntrophomonas sp.]|uniref:ABC transporter ATP-binding protein n=1 Tax=Syntrophomonas wolfei TaxID=863 RepID=UPI000774C7FB|nr:ABC transporter ATP-binding protein [Syntrophomonas wolfei]MDD2511137.1 ABC transporter ATP-binding protein [Syntrophomonas sp.]MDD3879460.1 ABC transporter ATP-binding protein [Syntrophomonas sp.]